MRFVDEVVIKVISGKGGDGCVSFRREKFVPKGGPDGGDGGRGGDVVIVASSDLTTLLDLTYKKVYRAPSGGHGKGKKRHGKDASPLYIYVPQGTQIKDADTGVLLKDLVHDGDSFVAAKGGQGGRGNVHFATSTNQAPRYAEKGKPGEEKRLLLELKLIADVGLIGLPNSGKSTLLNLISGSKSKVASYPFTTLVPHLGVVKIDEEITFSVADIPGIIEGAHKGVGLGIRFLRHIERTKLLVHLLDLSPAAQVPCEEAYSIMLDELRSYNPELLNKPQIVVANKIDLDEARQRFPFVKERLSKYGVPVYPISAKTGEGVERLIDTIAEKLKLVGPYEKSFYSTKDN